jgi:hypothetical protein
VTAGRQWTWRQHTFIAEGDATTVRAEAEAAARACQAANPGAEVGVMSRLVTAWTEHKDDTAEVTMDTPVIAAGREDVLRVLRRSFEHHFQPREIADPERYAQLAVDALTEAGLLPD